MNTFCRSETPQSTSLKTTHGIRLLLCRCDDPNNRWLTGSKRPRFTSLAYVTALTKVHPPLCILAERVFHRIYKGAPDPNFVYPLPSILCLPSPAVGIGRHRDFGTRSGKKKKPPCPDTSHFCVHWSKHDQTVCTDTMVRTTFVPP